MTDVTAGRLPRTPLIEIDRGPVATVLASLVVGTVTIGTLVDFRQAVLFLIGSLLGIALYHSSFGFTGGWRRFVVERRGASIRAQMLMIAVTAIAFSLHGWLWFAAAFAGSFVGVYARPVFGLDGFQAEMSTRNTLLFGTALLAATAAIAADHVASSTRIATPVEGAAPADNPCALENPCAAAAPAQQPIHALPFHLALRPTPVLPQTLLPRQTPGPPGRSEFASIIFVDIADLHNQSAVHESDWIPSRNPSNQYPSQFVHMASGIMASAGLPGGHRRTAGRSETQGCSTSAADFPCSRDR